MHYKIILSVLCLMSIGMLVAFLFIREQLLIIKKQNKKIMGLIDDINASIQEVSDATAAIATEIGNSGGLTAEQAQDVSTRLKAAANALKKIAYDNASTTPEAPAP